MAEHRREWLQDPDTIEFRKGLESQLEDLKETVFAVAGTVEQNGIMKIEASAQAGLLHNLISTLSGESDEDRSEESN